MVRTFSYAWIDHKLSLLDKFAKVSLVTFFEIIMLFAPLWGGGDDVFKQYVGMAY